MIEIGYRRYPAMHQLPVHWAVHKVEEVFGVSPSRVVRLVAWPTSFQRDRAARFAVGWVGPTACSRPKQQKGQGQKTLPLLPYQVLGSTFSWRMSISMVIRFLYSKIIFVDCK